MSSLSWSQQARRARHPRGLERKISDATARTLIRQFGALIRSNLGAKRSAACEALSEWYDGRAAAYQNAARLLYSQFSAATKSARRRSDS